MWTDPIVAEVRKAREAYARRFGFDLTRIVADLRKSEKKRAAGVKPAPVRKQRPMKKRTTKRRRAA